MPRRNFITTGRVSFKGVSMSPNSRRSYMKALRREALARAEAEARARFENPMNILRHFLTGQQSLLEIGMKSGMEATEHVIVGKEAANEFFDELHPSARFDVILIDGREQPEQVYRTIKRSLPHLPDHAVILIQGCCPSSERETGWKAVARLRAERSDLQVHVIGAGSGIGVIRRGRSPRIWLDKRWEELENEDLIADQRHLLGWVPRLYHDTPVLLISYETLRWLRDMVSDLLRLRFTNIHIVDNASTYPPLLDWFQQLPAGVVLHRLEANVGKYAPWKSGLTRQLTAPGGYYVVSDPDLDLSTLPDTTLEHMVSVFDEHPGTTKVGTAIRLDDVPKDSICGSYPERYGKDLFWSKTIGEDLYRGNIATTFAVYRVSNQSPSSSRRDVRCAGPYTVRHLPWYLRESDIGEEERHRYDSSRYRVSAQQRSGYWGNIIGNVIDGASFFEGDEHFKKWAESFE